ncbi:adenylate cyclase type 10 [Polyergus mexicanus]|uniref:adenylate cyclase type 10 n=1 Tax=Polyergus mexicanus TaxID=615972 RepID=UPI0038B67FA2
MAYDSINEENLVAAWTPDLFGPIFKKDSLTLKQALHLRNVNEQIHLMATFVPDEIIYETDLSEKSLRSFRAVLMFLNISGFSTLFKKYTYDKNGGSQALSIILNNCVHIVVQEIYCNEGDILKFSAQGLLAAWKVRDDEFIYNIIQKVIICAMNIQNSIAALKNNDEILKVSIAVSAGDVTFSIIGNSEARHFVLVGLPIEELKQANKISLSNDLILSLSAWQHCKPSQYEYVIKNPYNIKVIKVLEQPDTKLPYIMPILSNFTTISDEIFREGKSETNSVRPSSPYKARMSVDGKLFSDIVIADTKEKTSTAISAIAEMNPDFAIHLRSYLIKPVIQQIEKGISLRLLAEIRRITVVSLDIVPDKCPYNELILLIDKCFLLLHSTVTQYAGCINTVNLCEKNIFFSIVFGIRGCDEDQFKIDETCKKGLTFAMHALQTVKGIANVQSVFVGVSTGMAYCGVIGHIARKYYAVIGPPLDKVMRIINISYDKVSCDYDTVMHSNLKKYQFRSRGVRIFGRSEKFHVYEYLGDAPTKKDLNTTSSLDYCYPILDRTEELECFNNILDEIGVKNRSYSGLLIEGIERSGKSRLLDAFVTSVCNRQIKPIKLSLHATYADKAYSVIHHIILQILEAEDCDTVEEREKTLLVKLSNILALKDFCYLNVLMRVCFSLSDAYCSESDWQRHMKTINIFEMILKQLGIKICILLDDIQHMDYMSWQFLSSALNNKNVVVAMTMLKPNSWEDLSHVEVEIYKDKRFTKRVLLGLDVNLLPTFACQFLNVFAIPRKLNRTLRRRKDGHIGWCEALLTLILQSNGLDFITISPEEAGQHDLIFTDTSLVTKLPIDLMPEEIAPPLSWVQMSKLDVCVTNENYSKINDVDHDMREIMSKIYYGMNPYEHSFIKCAATLGKVFKRSMLQNVMPNSIPPHTINAVSEMIRIRILECASLQRRDFHTEDLIFCIDKKRKTFSDMHHLLSCHCHHSPVVLSSPLYAHCKMLEFKVDLFRSMMYDMQSNEEKQDHHAVAAKIYGLDARKCNSCGNGHFLRVPSKDKFPEVKCEYPTYSPRVSLVRHRTLIEDQNNRLTKSSILSSRVISSLKKDECVDIRRVSIMPSFLDDEEKERPKENSTNNTLKFWKRPARVAPETAKDLSYPNYLEEFSHIDYRNCQCDNVISHLFWKLHRHIEDCGEIDKVLDFFMEYSAGLIQTAQPLYAIKLLSIATEKNEAAEIDEWIDDNVEKSITNKGIILALMGDAHCALGNYDQAKKYYATAVKLRGTLLKTKKTICYRIISKIYCQMQYPPHYSINEVSRQAIVKKLELASYLRRLCVVYMIENKLTTAQAYALRSFKLAFSSIGSFLEKSEIYLVTVQVLHRIKNIEALRGELEEAINIGMKVLKISGALHLNKLMLVIVPSLTQIMLWTKRINEAVDLIRELYFLAEEDVDLSDKTWYHALSLEFILDAGVVLDSCETFYTYYKKCIARKDSKFCVWRDPQSLCRLLTCLWLYQLRMGHTITDAFTTRAEEFIKDVSCDDFSRIFTCIKGLECYLLMLLRCINMKQSDDLSNLIQDISKIIKCLENISKYAIVVKPRLYLLMAYLNVLRGRKSTTRFYLHKAQKFAISQGNKLIEAWIVQNKRTWKEKIYNNMARYWVEYIESPDFVAWQYIHHFNMTTWSTIFYPLPTPDLHL